MKMNSDNWLDQVTGGKHATLEDTALDRRAVMPDFIRQMVIEGGGRNYVTFVMTPAAALRLANDVEAAVTHYPMGAPDKQEDFLARLLAEEANQEPGEDQ